jgi:hypothetical protein
MAWLGLLLLSTVVLAAESDILNPQPSQVLAEIQGKLLSIDLTTTHLTVQDKSGQTVTVRFNKETHLLDSNNHSISWKELKINDLIHLYYNTREHNAVQVDRLNTLPDTILHPDK